MAKKDGPEQRRRILVVEDYPATVELMKSLLEAAGYEASAAYSGKRGLEAARAWKPDLILLDVMMPEMSGIEVCNQLKADPETSAIPVVIVSIRAAEEDVRVGVKAGAAAYMVKPFEPADLLALVKKHA